MNAVGCRTPRHTSTRQKKGDVQPEVSQCADVVKATLSQTQHRVSLPPAGEHSRNSGVDCRVSNADGEFFSAAAATSC
jgi:hypothetical protein